MIRVAVDGQTFASPDADRGIGVYLKSLLRHMPEVPGFRFELLRWGPAPAGLPSAEDLPTVRLSDAGLPDMDDGSAPLTRRQTRSLAVRRHLRRSGSDVLYNPNPLQPGVELLARPGLVPLVATVHDLTPLVLPDIFLGPGHREFESMYRARLDLLTAQADRLVTISEATRQDVIRLLGYPASRVSVVHDGVDPVFRPDAGPDGDHLVFETLNREDGEPPILPGRYLITVGGYNPKKNHERLFAALGMLPPKLLTGMPLVLAGPLDARDWKIIAGLRDRFCPAVALRRAGYVDDATLAALYRHARLLAFPSLHEGFGLPVLEAMSCGCPALGGEAGAVPEVAAGAARLCDPKSAESVAEGLEELLASEKLRAELRERGLRRARDFSWRKAAHEIARVLQSAVEHRLFPAAPDAAPDAAAEAAPGQTPRKAAAAPPLFSSRSPDYRPRLLWYSPLPPDPGGVSAYSASLLQEIADGFDITLVRDPELDPAPGLDGFPVITPEQAAAAQADLRIYHMGNNLAQCARTYDALRAVPGLTVVHDLNIHGFLLEHLVRRDPPGKLKGAALEQHAYFRALTEAHGEAGARQARQVLANKALPDIARFPCHRLLTASSAALITHSRWGRDRLEANGDSAPVFTLPLGIEHPLLPPPGADAQLRRAIGAGEKDFVLACAGYLEPNRRLDSVLLALSELARRGVHARLVLAGGIDPSHRRWLDGIAQERGIADRVTWRGFLRDDNDFLATLAAADVVVHLRHPTNGESSATILRALSMGRPVIVSAADSYRELPESCCWKVDADRTEVPLLAEYLEVLARRPEVRAAMSAAARRHIALHHAWPEAARRFREIVRTVLEQRAGFPACAVARTSGPR